MLVARGSIANRPRDPRHGTPNGYSNLGCRCRRCREAQTEYLRARGIGPYRTDPCPECGNPKTPVSARCRDCENAEREAPHGTESRYSRCGCEECRAAAAEARRERRHAARVPCSHGCGTLVDSYNYHYPEKPPECRPCAMRRVHAERRKAALA